MLKTTRLFLMGLILIVSCRIHVQGQSDPLIDIAKSMGKTLRKLNKPRVGVLPFPYLDGRTGQGSKIVSERLTTYLTKTKNITVVERELISKILQEEHLEMTGVIDSGTAQKIGKVLGVDVIVTGTLLELKENQIEVNARAINGNNGSVLDASRVVIEKEWKDAPRPTQQALPARPLEPDEENPNDHKPIVIGYPPDRSGPPSPRIFVPRSRR